MIVKRASLVDFHCHLDLYPDLESAVAACEAARVFTLAVTTTPRAWPRNHELASKTRHVRAALGLHPQLVSERAHEITLWEELLPRTQYVGEVGLDAGPRFFRSFEQQKEIFGRVLQLCARAGGKIVSVHSVRSAKAVLDMIEANLPASRGRVVLHWFTGTRSEARRAVDLGCYFSINRQMIVNEKHRAVVAQLPLNRLLTETDGPFTQTDGRPTRPADAGLTVDAIATLRGETPETVSRLILGNLRQLLHDVDSSAADVATT
jgi:TatD DNase family protein